ncbi:PAS domain S-box-containing protein/diguanylate cyclase (GGDEF) domain-containing protein [Oryzisolibacter propanilivorax]|uniref:PAS domain S-box-containing protein/diguanylate cyclase (GGDEF) domain-containing protein n=1 Tax=Oryzisolibacter propanilivorax TaxID=1527607 RepID=A0A1G9TIF8_9BURK|nr:PAS domain S-box-containing protein/diguanylate cyclase (GGDEF) domain-containing protein [Oryzisolibacter propanilivorax]
MTPVEHAAALRALSALPPDDAPPGAAQHTSVPAPPAGSAPLPADEALTAPLEDAGDVLNDPPELPGGWFPGPLVRRLMLVTLLAVAAAGALSGWLMARAAAHDALQRLVAQQSDEVELVARLLASKIEQSQKVLATVAESISPQMLDSPASLEWLLQQGLPAVRFFDAMQVVRRDGRLSVNLRYGRLEPPSELDPEERDHLRRTLLDGKPLVSGLLGRTPQEARVMFTVPLLRGEGRPAGAVAGVLRLQSQGLLPHSLALPARPDSRLVVFTDDGVILSHPDPARVLGQVRDEPGLAEAYALWRSRGRPLLPSEEMTQLPSGHVVSLAAVPMPQWMVARVSDPGALLEPVQGMQQRAWLQAGAATVVVALLALLAMGALARPLALLRQRAMQLQSRSGAAPALPDWPRSPGEVDDVVRVCLGLLEHRRAQQHGSQALMRQLQAVLAHVPLGIAVTRAERVEVVSLQACRLLGHTPAELHGCELLELLAPASGDTERLARHVRAQFAAHGAFDGELPLLRRDGGVQWVRAHGRPVRVGEPDAGTVWTLEDCSATRDARQQPAWQNSHDALTLLPHRAAFERRLRALLHARAARGGTRPPATPGLYGDDGDGVLMFMDLDHFAVINDLAGHDAGDDVLRYMARLLESEVRQTGWAARLGGDEFALVLPGATPARGQAVAEQLRAAVQAWEPCYGGRSFTLGLSIGLVPLPAGLRDVAPLLHAADMACYAAKRAGRNRVEVRRVALPSEPPG